MSQSMASGWLSALSRLPEEIAVRLPQGQQMGTADAPVRLSLSRWSSIARLKAGQIGALAEEYVEGKLQFEGAMRDLMGAMLKLLPDKPVKSDKRWWSRLATRTRSATTHTRDKHSAQIQFYYDVSDAFYGLRLDPRRVYSCAYYRDSGMSAHESANALTGNATRLVLFSPGFPDAGRDRDSGARTPAGYLARNVCMLALAPPESLSQHGNDSQPNQGSPGHDPGALGRSPQRDDQKYVVRQHGEMHHGGDQKVEALRCKHQCGKACKKVDDAAHGQHVAPINHRR